MSAIYMQEGIKAKANFCKSVFAQTAQQATSAQPQHQETRNKAKGLGIAQCPFFEDAQKRNIDVSKAHHKHANINANGLVDGSKQETSNSSNNACAMIRRCRLRRCSLVFGDLEQLLMPLFVFFTDIALHFTDNESATLKPHIFLQ